MKQVRELQRAKLPCPRGKDARTRFKHAELEWFLNEKPLLHKPSFSLTPIYLTNDTRLELRNNK